LRLLERATGGFKQNPRQLLRREFEPGFVPRLDWNKRFCLICGEKAAFFLELVGTGLADKTVMFYRLNLLSIAVSD
jgi:hypothetical protein